MRRYLRILIVIAVATTFPLLVVRPGAAQASPICPETQDAVTDYVPSFGRVGEGLAIRLEIPQRKRVLGLEIVAFGNQPEKRLEVLPNARNTSVVIPAGKAGVMQLEFLWEQDVGMPSACAGLDQYRIPIIPPQASAGDVEVPRLEGRFAVVERGHRKPRLTQANWVFAPLCGFFACDAKVQSTKGLAGRFKLLTNGTYVLRRSEGRSGTCVGEERNSLTGELIGTFSISRAWYESEEVRLHVIAAANRDRVVGFTGSIVTTYTPTPRAEHHQCQPGHYRETFRGALR